MPQFERKKIDLSTPAKKPATKAKAESDDELEEDEEEPTPRKQTAMAKSSTRALVDDEDDDGDDDEGVEDDEIIQTVAKGGKANPMKNKMVVGAIVVVIGVIFLFLLFRGIGNRGNDEQEPSPADETVTQEPTEQAPPAEQPPTVPEAPEVVPEDTNIGMQDFTQNTTMMSDSEMSDPDDFTKDIYGLTLRVNFEVSAIQSAVDMVNYTKHRGTWGGGLELYYLDVTYNNSKYVMQIPFEYYKELDDTGIVPVKMEVLRVKSETDDSYLTVISYMELDEATLTTILRSQKNARK